MYETGDAAHLVLNFSQYLGATLVQVAQMDPEYVHQLALSAQRPEVRAAARQMVIALEVVAEQPAIGHAVRCLPLFDILELQLEVLHEPDWPDFEQPEPPLPPNVIRFRPRRR